MVSIGAWRQRNSSQSKNIAQSVSAIKGCLSANCIARHCEDFPSTTVSGRGKDVHRFFGGAGNDTLVGGNARDILDGGTGNDVIRGGKGSSKIYGGPGNDDISDGEGGSEIHTGPGRNIVRSEGGDDRMFIGNGRNHIAPGPGNAVFVVEYGGITEFETWDDTYVLDLSNWASAPTITKNDAGYTDVVLGVSVVRIHANIDEKKIRAQIQT